MLTFMEEMSWKYHTSISKLPDEVALAVVSPFFPRTVPEDVYGLGIFTMWQNLCFSPDWLLVEDISAHFCEMSL